MNITDPPPPPYSETDIYFNGSSNESSTGTNLPSPGRSGRDALAPATSSLSSQPQSVAGVSSDSQSDVIYTPALSSTRRSSVNDSFLPSSSSSSAAAQAYFDTRPLPSRFFPDRHITHTITLSSSSRPEDFPYNQEWAARHVSSSDWHTFLNFLLPSHTTTRNQAIIDRKLLAEEEGASLASSIGRTHASARLEQLRRASAADAVAVSPVTGVNRESEAVTAEWNASFFQPRAMWVRLTFELPQPQFQPEQRPHMPGAWDSSFDQHHQQGIAGPSMPPPNQPMLFQPYWTPQQQPKPPSRGGFNFAGISLNDDGFSIGNTLVADRNGVRVGGLVADTNGVRYRDNVIAGPGMFSGGSNHGYPGSMYHAAHPNVYQGPPQIHAHYARPNSSTGLPPGPGPGSLPGSFPTGDQKPYGNRPPFAWGPTQTQPPQHQQHRSEASSGSESSTCSGSSLPSLPEHDELSVSQLPVFHSTLRTWLTQPEKHVTKHDVQRLTAELAEAKRIRSEYPPQNLDDRAMRAEIKSLSQEFRALRRAQRAVRRERRREKKARKKAERKERREQRRGNSLGLGRGVNQWRLPGMPPPGMPPPGMPPPGMPPPGLTLSMGPPGGFPPNPWNSGPISAPPCAPPFGYATGSRGSHDSPSSAGSREQQVGQTTSSSENLHTKSQEKFNQLDELEKELARRCSQLDETRDRQLKSKQDADQETGPVAPETQKTRGEETQAGAGKQAQTSSDRTRLEEEVDVLMRDVERLRLEADEAFARELEEQERREAGASR